jgi:hypothetical protein
MLRLITLTAALVSSAVLAQTVPGSISFNARLTDTAGAPISGSHTLTFSLFSQASGGAAAWTETQSGATFSTEGVVYAELGSVTSLTPAALDGSKLFLEISVDGTIMTPRLAVVSVPYAIRASVAASALSIGSITETNIQRRVTGTCSSGNAIRSIDGSGGVQCEPTGMTGGLTGVTAGAGLTGGGTTGNVNVALQWCANGEILSSTGAGWQCAAPPPAFNGMYTGNSTFTGNVTITGTLNATVVAGLGESRATPATSCAALHTARASLPSGVYWLMPSSTTSAFQAYCDMVNEGGGWTLVWSNLRGGRGKGSTELQWKNAVETLPRFGSTPIGTDLESFTVYTGIKHFTTLAPGGLMRYDWSTDYGQAVSQRRVCPFALIPTAEYQITFTTASCTAPIGSVPAGLFTSHNNARFSAYDRDNDSGPTTNCGATYGNTPFWYTNCWDGMIWGGSELSANYANGAYWAGSANQFAVVGSTNGVGAGNGWLWVK